MLINVNLANLTTVKTRGYAKRFAVVKTLRQLNEAIVSINNNVI